MPKHDTDPVLRQLVRAINESDTGSVPVTLSVHGATVRGALVPERRYFAELVQRNPVMSALEPSSGLLGKDYVKHTEAESDHHLHVLGESVPSGTEAGEDLWRISLEAVDGWSLRHGAEHAEGDKGPFSRLLNTRATA